MNVPHRPITIVRGDTYAHEVAIDDGVDRSGWSWLAQVRRRCTDSVVATFAVEWAEWVDADEVDREGPVLSLTAAQTADLSPLHRDLVYDLQGTNGTDVATLMGGPVTVIGDVSRA